MPGALKDTAEARRSNTANALKLMVRDGSTLARNKIKRTELQWNGNLRPALRKFHKYSINVDIDSPEVKKLYALSFWSYGSGISRISPRNSPKGENNFLQKIISPIYSIPYTERLRSFHPSNSYPLDYYITNGGNCIAKSLMTIAVLQRYREEGRIGGVFGIRYNFDEKTNAGHAWVSYTDSNGVTIVDPTAGLLIKLGDNETNKAIESFLINANGWNYFDVKVAKNTLLKKSVFNSLVVGYSFVGTYAIHVGYLGTLAVAAAVLQVSGLIRYKKDTKRQTS